MCVYQMIALRVDVVFGFTGRIVLNVTDIAPDFYGSVRLCYFLTLLALCQDSHIISPHILLFYIW